jgi:hypothetical protein
MSVVTASPNKEAPHLSFEFRKCQVTIGHAARASAVPAEKVTILMNEPLPLVTTRSEAKGLPHVIAAVVLIMATLAIFAYLIAVVTGKICKACRLGPPEVGLAVIACLFLVLVIHPAALDRLNLVKLPWGIEVTLEKIQHQQG